MNLTTEFERCRWDVERFARVFLGVVLHPGQVRMTKAYLQRTESRWRALYQWIMVAAGNRAGKTLALAIVIVHSCVYRMGLEPPPKGNALALQRWGRLPYDWWHFAIEQGPAEQVFAEIVKLLGGIHPAQKEGCPWSRQMGEGDQAAGAEKIATMADTGLGYDWCKGSKERGEYALIKFAPDLGGATIHFRSTKAKALGSLGQNMHGVSFDEAGLEPNLDFLLNEVLHFRRLGTGGPFILISTPSEDTGPYFADLWLTGDPDDPFRSARRFSMRMSSRENVGYGLEQETFDSLLIGLTPQTIAQNIDGEFIQAKTAWFNAGSVDAAFRDNLPEEEEPRLGAVYVHALDPGLKDTCWSLVFRIRDDGTAVGVKIERMYGKQTTRGIVALGVRNHRAYSMDGKAPDQIATGVDTTALGGHMFRELLEEYIPIQSVEFGGVTQTKRRLLSDLRTALDENRLEMPTEGDWAEVRKQLRNYKLLDRKIDQDLVMSLAIIVKLIRQRPLRSAEPAPKFDYFSRGEEKSSDSPQINSQSVRAQYLVQRRAELDKALGDR